MNAIALTLLITFACLGGLVILGAAWLILTDDDPSIGELWDWWITHHAL